MPTTTHKQKITVAVTGLNAIDSPGPGVPVIRALKESTVYEVRIIGLAYESLEPGIYMHDLVDKTYQIPLPSAGKFSMIKSLTSPTQIAPDIQAGKIGYLIIKLDSGLKFENLQLVNMRIDEKGIDSQRFIIRIGMAA